MNTFEFIGIMQAHGFPKVLGCLTHLDKLKTNKAAKKAKKVMKKRFWRETYAEAIKYMQENPLKAAPAQEGNA